MTVCVCIKMAVLDLVNYTGRHKLVRFLPNYLKIEEKQSDTHVCYIPVDRRLLVLLTCKVSGQIMHK